jgi:hypothetical protein
MKHNGGKKKPKAKVIREKRPTARAPKRPPMVPCLPLGKRDEGNDLTGIALPVDGGKPL